MLHCIEGEKATRNATRLDELGGVLSESEKEARSG